MVTRQRINFQTPLGRAKYAWLTNPDTKFSTEGIYSTQLIVDPLEAEGLKAVVEKARTDLFPNSNANIRMPYEADPETGQLIFKMKSKYQPAFYDSQGQVIPEGKVPALFGGSLIRVGGVITSYEGSSTGAGVTLNINKVQIVDAVSGSGGDDGGFDSVEGGFVAEQQDTFDAPEQTQAPAQPNEAINF
jgi:hypothetical protein